MQLGQALELGREIQEITELTYWQVDKTEALKCGEL